MSHLAAGPDLFVWLVVENQSACGAHLVLQGEKATR
jgi:hypothetical protein